MTSKLHTQEIASWAYQHQDADPDSYRWLLTQHEPAKAKHVAAEIAYIQYFGKVPEWAAYIEAFEVVNGNYIYIHRDPDAAQ